MTRSATQDRTHRERTQANTTSKRKRTAGRHSTALHGNTAPPNTGHTTGERGTTTNHSTQQDGRPRGQAGANATTHASGKQQQATRPSNEQSATTGNNTQHQLARTKQHGTTSKTRRRQHHTARQTTTRATQDRTPGENTTTGHDRGPGNGNRGQQHGERTKLNTGTPQSTGQNTKHTTTPPQDRRQHTQNRHTQGATDDTAQALNGPCWGTRPTATHTSTPHSAEHTNQPKHRRIGTPRQTKRGGKKRAANKQKARRRKTKKKRRGLGTGTRTKDKKEKKTKKVGGGAGGPQDAKAQGTWDEKQGTTETTGAQQRKIIERKKKGKNKNQKRPQTGQPQPGGGRTNQKRTKGGHRRR